MAALTLEEVKKMHKTLKEAFDAASRNWDYTRREWDSHAGKRANLLELSAAATALLKADERLREMEETSGIGKTAVRLPGKG